MNHGIGAFHLFAYGEYTTHIYVIVEDNDISILAFFLCTLRVGYTGKASRSFGSHSYGIFERDACLLNHSLY